MNFLKISSYHSQLTTFQQFYFWLDQMVNKVLATFKKNVCLITHFNIITTVMGEASIISLIIYTTNKFLDHENTKFKTIP